MRVVVLLVLCACSTDPDPGPEMGARDAASAADAAPQPGVDAAPSMGEDAATFSCGPVKMAGHQSVTCGGVVFEVEASAACVAGGPDCGAIVDVHGFTMSADQEDQHTRMRSLAPPRGYVLVQPTAPGFPASWGEGEHDEVVWDFLVATVTVFDVDRDRVHVMGFSQGGMMTNRLICAHADALASVAPTAGARCFNQGDAPAVEIPILYTHGTNDHIVPFSDAEAYRAGALAAWPFGAPTVFDTGAGYTATRWTTSSGTDFELWEHDFEAGLFIDGHCLPGPASSATYRCQDEGQFDHSMEVLRFFDAHPRD
jgi:pimeloyl-ACP methyl ester carboxylesterase